MWKEPIFLSNRSVKQYRTPPKPLFTNLGPFPSGPLATHHFPSLSPKLLLHPPFKSSQTQTSQQYEFANNPFAFLLIYAIKPSTAFKPPGTCYRLRSLHLPIELVSAHFTLSNSCFVDPTTLSLSCAAISNLHHKPTTAGNEHEHTYRKPKYISSSISQPSNRTTATLHRGSLALDTTTIGGIISAKSCRPTPPSSCPRTDRSTRHLFAKITTWTIEEEACHPSISVTSLVTLSPWQQFRSQWSVNGLNSQMIWTDKNDSLPG